MRLWITPLPLPLWLLYFYSEVAEHLIWQIVALPPQAMQVGAWGGHVPGTRLSILLNIRDPLPKKLFLLWISKPKDETQFSTSSNPFMAQEHCVKRRKTQDTRGDLEDPANRTPLLSDCDLCCYPLHSLLKALWHLSWPCSQCRLFKFF